MTSFVNLIVTNGGTVDPMTGFTPNPGMDGDNLINTDIVTLVTYSLSSTEAQFQISTNITFTNAMGGDQLRTYNISASKAITGSYVDAASVPSAQWMVDAKKAILAAISNQSPGGSRTNVVLPKDGNANVYFRSFSLI